jgi:osmoprotectant transport system substrate-binding protein
LTGFGDKSEQGVEMQRFPSAIVAAMLSTVAVGADAEPIKLGSKAFIENILVAEITKQYLEAKGLEADLRSGLGSTVIREAIVSRQIDLY